MRPCNCFSTGEAVRMFKWFHIGAYSLWGLSFGFFIATRAFSKCSNPCKAPLYQEDLIIYMHLNMLGSAGTRAPPGPSGSHCHFPLIISRGKSAAMLVRGLIHGRSLLRAGFFPTYLSLMARTQHGSSLQTHSTMATFPVVLMSFQDTPGYSNKHNADYNTNNHSTCIVTDRRLLY